MKERTVIDKCIEQIQKGYERDIKRLKKFDVCDTMFLVRSLDIVRLQVTKYRDEKIFFTYEDGTKESLWVWDFFPERDEQKRMFSTYEEAKENLIRNLESRLEDRKGIVQDNIECIRKYRKIIKELKGV